MESEKLRGGNVLRIVAGVIGLALLLAGGTEAATFTVDNSSSANYKRIQDAIDNGDGKLVVNVTATSQTDPAVKATITNTTIILLTPPPVGGGGGGGGSAGGGGGSTVIWDEASGSPLPFTWNHMNFDGFNLGGIGNENLTIVQTDLGAADGKTRTIRNWDNLEGAGLIYNTTRYLVEYEISKNKGLIVEQSLNSAGYKCNFYYYCYGSYYAKVNLFGEPYIALNGKVNKLTKLVLEQKSNEQRTLSVGETWNMGDGYTLTALSIDARASPRQVWLIISKDGIKLDDKVVAQGQVYTYVEKSIGGESDVPLFATYVDSVFSGTTSDFIVLKYTWLISKTITEILTGDRFSLLRVNSYSENEIKFDNDYTISLVPNTTIILAGNIKFRVIDNTTYLKFYPTVEPRLNITTSSLSIPAGTSTNVIFTVESNGLPIDGVSINLKGAALGSGITGTNGNASISINASNNGTIIAEAQKSGYTGGTTTIQAHALPTPAMASWELSENYTLNLTDIDIKAMPRQARLQLSRNGVVAKDSVVMQGGTFEYCPFNCTFNATLDVVFGGEQGYLVRLINTSQYSESTGLLLLDNITYLYKTANITGISWELQEGYDLRMMDFDARAAPRLVWLELLKNNTITDDAVVAWGEKYYYNSSGSTILTAKVDAIFKGENSSIVKLKEVTQHSETSGEVLLDNDTHSYIYGVINRTDQPLYEGYTISALGIDAFASPYLAWLRLYKNDIMVDERIAMQGDIWSYNSVLYAEVDAIFASRTVDAVQLRNVTQYSESDGSMLINGTTITIFTKGSPTPLPTSIPAYGTYEVAGTSAGESAIAGEFNISTLPATWTPYSFAGIYYDLEYNLGREELSIKSINIPSRTIPKGGLYYNTSLQSMMLNVVKYAFGGNATAAQAGGLTRTDTGEAFEGGNYQVVGWQGEKYAALNNKTNKLAKLVLEHGAATSEKKTMTAGETWDIGGGWMLTAQAIDAKVSPRQAWLVLSYQGIKLDDRIISDRSVYTYESIGDGIDAPNFVTYIDSVFAGATSDMVQLRYTWAISRDIIDIINGEPWGVMKVIDDGSLTGKIVTRNDDSSVTLYRDNTTDIMGNLKFRVSDSDILRFMPLAVLPHQGIYTIRGAVWNGTPIYGFGGSGNIAVWNASNFAGFSYDFDLGKEELKILQTNLNSNSRTINTNNLTYSTSAQPKMLNVVKHAFGGNVSAAASAGLERTGSGEAFENGSYYIAGWQGERYVALNGRINKLAKLVMEQGSEKKSLTAGEMWNLGDGWTLTVQSIDSQVSPHQVRLILGKDGVKLDDKIIGQGGVYVYTEKSISGESDVPLFVTFVDSILSGATTDIVFLRYTWSISRSITEIKSGDRFGALTVVDLDIANKHIGLKNRDATVGLTQETVDIMGSLRFMVCGTYYWNCSGDVLRFMPEVIRFELLPATEPQPLILIDGGSAYTNSTPVHLTLSAPGATEMSFKDESSNWTSWEPFTTTKSWMLSSGDGLKRIYFKARNGTGEFMPVSVSIILDTTKPKVANLSISTFTPRINEPVNISAKVSDTNVEAFPPSSPSITVYVRSPGGYINKSPMILSMGPTTPTDSRTLTVGESWDVGRGWTLSARSIDARATPRQAWIVIMKDGAVMDDRIISEGGSFIYYASSKSQQQFVPLFIVYAESIFPGATSDMVKLGFTWYDEISQTYYYNFTNTSEYGRYDISITATDPAGNVNDTERTWFVTTMPPYINQSVNTTANNVTAIDASEKANTTLELVTSSDTTSGAISIMMSNDIPPEISQSFNLTPLGKYISINASENIRQNLTWIKLKFYYTKAELEASGLDEASLRISWYNESSAPYKWENLSTGSPQWVHGAGVETADINGYAGYVWANISHLSTFVLVGSYPAPAQTSAPGSGNDRSSGGGGGGGGGGTSGENFLNIEVKEKYELHIFKDKVTSYRFVNRSNPVLFINITGNINAGETTTMVEVLRSTSVLVKEKAPGIVYKNANIWVGTSGFATAKNIKDARIKFKVENSWLSGNSLTASHIKMMKWDGNKWITLETSEVGKDDANTYFEAMTESFSPFAVVGVMNIPKTAPSVVVTETPLKQSVNATHAEPKGTPGFEAAAAIAVFSGLCMLVRKRRLLRKSG